ncbi:uncharacterized protein [Engystomops pustulosus]|uniref:uncharacterized protein n=1 Tax=Engystomops pustulosus TaxID=76066 RepID=UPI003AFABF23
MADAYDICVEYVIAIGEEQLRGRYGIYRRIIYGSTSQVVVFCGKVSMWIMFFMRAQCDDKTLIVPVGGLEAALISKIRKSLFHGCLVFSPSTKIFPELKKYIKEMILASRPNDLYMEYILAYHFSCLTSDPYINKVFRSLFRLKECNRTLVLDDLVRSTYAAEDFRVAYLVYKSVYALAHSLHDLQLYAMNTNKNFRESHSLMRHVREI